jgi:hypothetical protein
VTSRAEVREVAVTMRRTLGAESVLIGMEDGDVAGEHIRRIAVQAFELAEAGLLSAKSIEPLARFATRLPRVATWVSILRSLLVVQEAGQ